MSFKRCELLKIPVTLGPKIDYSFQLPKKYDINGREHFILCWTLCWALGRQKRHGPYSKGALFKEETVTQRTTNFLKRQKGKVQDAVRTRNREKNWSSLGSQRRIC